MRTIKWLPGILWVAIFLSVLIWSGISPYDRLTWALEVSPAVIGGLILLISRQRFPLTPLTYQLILLHAVVLMIGGHYTYAKVPLFDFLGEVFDSQRNNYDKLGHFFQGFVPAIIAREILLRLSVISRPRWLVFLVVCICLAISAFYELIEWWAALLAAQSAEAFLGTQGYIWDTQSDMAWALSGAILACLLLGKVHNRQLDKLS